MSTPEEIWTARLHAAVDDHPGAMAFDVASYVAAGRKRARRNRAAVGIATVAAVAAAVAGAAVATSGTRGGAPQPADPVVPNTTTLGPGTAGWVAVDASDGGGEIYLVRPGEDARRLEVAGAAASTEACPAWSPDGRRLLFGRVTGSSDSTSGAAELVIAPVRSDGAIGNPKVIGLDGFEVLEGLNPHPCATWAADGRWVAFAGTGEVWVVDTRAGSVRRLPDLRPSDLEWRPGTDQLAIAGDMGTNRGAPTASTPVTVYSVSTDELRQLGSVEAAHITWSPDGATLAYTGGEIDRPELWLVDGDGANERLLVADHTWPSHGIGPVWSPTGDRIAYQRPIPGAGESEKAVLVNVADGTETVIEPPEADGRVWYPSTVTWSPDGATLLYTAWDLQSVSGGVIAVPADEPSDATVLTDAIDALGTARYVHGWAPIQMWGRQSG
jgi:Tol biopolymer transport system component